MLDAWGIPEEPCNLPVLLVPDSLAWLIETGKWEDVVLLTRWHKHLHLRNSEKTWERSILPSHLPQWPPQESPAWGFMGKYLGDPEAPAFEPPELDAQNLRVLAGSGRLALPESLQKCVTLWRHWRSGRPNLALQQVKMRIPIRHASGQPGDMQRHGLRQGRAP